MVRTILSVVAGYIIMALCVMVLFTAYYFVLGADGSYRPGSYDVTGLWIAGSFVMSFIAAFLGGYSAAVIARNQTAPRVLAAIVVVLGLILAVTYSPEGIDAIRTGDVGIMDAMSLSVEPQWVAVVTPLIGAIGVVLGASRVRMGRPEPAGAPASDVNVAPAGPVGPAAPPADFDEGPASSSASQL